MLDVEKLNLNDGDLNRCTVRSAVASISDDVIKHQDFFEHLCHVLFERGFSIRPNWNELLDASDTALRRPVDSKDLVVFPTRAIHFADF